MRFIAFHLGLLITSTGIFFPQKDVYVTYVDLSAKFNLLNLGVEANVSLIGILPDA